MLRGSSDSILALLIAFQADVPIYIFAVALSARIGCEPLDYLQCLPVYAPIWLFLSSRSRHNVQTCILKNAIAYGRINLGLCFQKGCSSRKYEAAQPRKQSMTFV